MTNREEVEVVIDRLKYGDRFERWNAASYLGSMGQARKDLGSRIISVLSLVKIFDPDHDVQEMASQSIKEVKGEFNRISEKHNPIQTPQGPQRDQYYLVRG